MSGIKVAAMACGIVAGMAAGAAADAAGSGASASTSAPAQPANAPMVAPPGLASATETVRKGVTFEANLGLGWLRVAPEESMTVTESALGGLNLGIGGWLSSRAALSFRIAGATYSEEGGSITSGFAGGALQLWASDAFWFGGGLGMGFVSVDLEDGPDPDVETGLGLDLRVGITPVMSGSHSLNFSFEISPVYLDGGTITSMGLLLGYQYL